MFEALGKTFLDSFYAKRFGTILVIRNTLQGKNRMDRNEHERRKRESLRRGTQGKGVQAPGVAASGAGSG